MLISVNCLSSVFLIAIVLINLANSERINKLDCASGPCINICEGTLQVADQTSGFNLNNVEFTADQINLKKLQCRKKPLQLKANLLWEVSTNGVLVTTFPVHEENYCVNRTDDSLRVCDVCEFENCVRMCNKTLDKKEVIVQGMTFKRYKKHFPCAHYDMATVQDYQILPSGIIKTDIKHFNITEYCLFENETLHVCTNSEAFVKKPRTALSILALMLLSCSIPCLVVTIVVYVIVNGFTHIHHKNIVCYFISLTLLFVALLTVKENWLGGYPIPCDLLALIHYFVILTAFSWLLVMAWDKLYMTWNDQKLLNRICREHCSCRKRFIWSCCFCYGIPAAVVAVLAGLLVTSRFRFSQFFCGFSFKHEVLIFLPITILTVLNFVFYVVIANKLQTFHRNIINNTQMAHNVSLLSTSLEPPNKYQTRPVVRIAGTLIDKKKFEQEKQMIWTQFRLFLIMGVFWVSEAITFWLGSKDFLTITLDLINCSQGIIIFCLFGWNRKLLEDLGTKLQKLFDAIANKFI